MSDFPDQSAKFRYGPRICPACEYSLSGLPREHTCPECGREYTQSDFIETPVIGRLPRWAVAFPLVFVLLVGARLTFSFIQVGNASFGAVVASLGIVGLTLMPLGFVTVVAHYYARTTPVRRACEEESGLLSVV